jgi:hypothetical protein
MEAFDLVLRSDRTRRRLPNGEPPRTSMWRHVLVVVVSAVALLARVGAPSPAQARPAPVDDAIARYLLDFERRAESERRRKRHFRQWFEVLNVVIGLPAAVLAGAATVTALKDIAPNVVAALAGAATVLTGAQVFLRAADRASYNRAREAEFGRLVAEARRAREIELPLEGHEHIAAKLESLEAAFADLLRAAPTSAK